MILATWVSGEAMTVGDLRMIALALMGTGITGMVIAAIALLVRKSGKSGVPHFTVIIISLTILAIGLWTRSYTKYPAVGDDMRLRDFSDIKNSRTTWDQAIKMDYTFLVDMEERDPKTLDRDLYKYEVNDEEKKVYADRRGHSKSGLQYILLFMPLLVVLILFFL